MKDLYPEEEQKPEYTEDELAGMTEEERKAITDEDEGDVSKAEGEDDGQKEEEQQEKAGAKEEVTPSLQTTFVPSFQMGTTEDLQAKLDALDKQLEEGDIDIIQYTKQRDPIIQQRTEAELAAKFNQQSSEQLWQYEQRLFFSSYPQFRDNAVLNGALGKIFKSLDTQDNAHRTGFELLNEAREQVESQLSSLYGGQKPSTPTPATPTGKDAAQKPPVKDGKPALEKVALPRTLANVPVAEQNDTGQDEFAHLDSLSGMDFEKSLSKLTPDQQQRYLRA